MLQCETCNWYRWCYCVCVRLPRPGSRASSRASSRADWCVTPNAYHREEMDDPNSNRKVTRVCYVTWVTLNAVLVVQSDCNCCMLVCVCVCVCVLSTLFVLLIILSLILMQSDFKLLTFCHCWPCFVTKQLFLQLTTCTELWPSVWEPSTFPCLWAEWRTVVVWGGMCYETWSVMKEMAPCCTEQRMMRCLWCKIERQVFCVGLKQKLRTWDVIPMLLEIFWGYVVNGHVLTKRVIGWKGVWNMT